MMTEKRFTMSDDGGVGLWTIYDNGKWLSAREIVECLNNLHEENEQLKQDGLYWAKTAEARLKEIEKLQQRNKRLKEKIQRERTSFMKTHERWSKEAENKIKELSEENEQLKSENNMLKVTIGRNEAYIKRLTQTSDWHC